MRDPAPKIETPLPPVAPLGLGVAGARFAQGILIAHDGDDEPSDNAMNYKLTLAGRRRPAIQIDTAAR